MTCSPGAPTLTTTFGIGTSLHTTCPLTCPHGPDQSQFQEEKWVTVPTYIVPLFVALPSSFHIPSVSSKNQSEIVAGAELCWDDAIGIESVAGLPGAG